MHKVVCMLSMQAHSLHEELHIHIYTHSHAPPCTLSFRKRRERSRRTNKMNPALLLQKDLSTGALDSRSHRLA